MLKRFSGILGILLSISGSIQAQQAQEYKLVNMGRKVNSKYHDSTPIVSPDGNTLYFTITNHPENTKGLEGSQDIWYSVKDSTGNWSESVHMGKPFNKNRYNQVLSVSLDGNRLLIRGGNGSDDLGFSISRKENGIWQKPEALDIPEFEEMCKGMFNGAFLSYDDKALLMYFSERPKSKYSDLYISYHQSGNQWTQPVLIQSLNTHMDEFGPYLAPDNKTLYFASNRGGGFGNMDVYESQRLDDTWQKWSEPVNVGAPVNTSGFDAYYSVGLNDTLVFTTRAFMSADGGHLDIFSLKRIIREDPKIHLEGVVMHKESWDPIQAHIRYRRGDEVLGVLESSADRGEFKTSLSDTAKYYLEVNAEGYFRHEDSVMVYGDIQADTVFYKEIFMKPIEVGVSVRLNNIFFDYNESTLRSESFPELDKVVEFLQDNPKLEVEIAGHTDDQGSDEYNENLSQGRAESVVKYLIDNWVDEQRVKAKGYGESKPEVPNDSDENRQINRRVEFTILKN